MRYKLLTAAFAACAGLAGPAMAEEGDQSAATVDVSEQVAQLVRPALSLPESLPAAEVEVNGEVLPMQTWFTTVLPGQELNISLPGGHTMWIDGRNAGRRGVSTIWRAPEEAATTDIVIRTPDGELANHLTVFTLEPATNIRNGRLNGYRIGSYPRGTTPAGFIRLNGPSDMQSKVSPHFRVGQFICKQQPGHWPKYVLVTPSLLKRLESVLTELNRTGETRADTLFVMSGYRTPSYNAGIRGAKKSRHMYGDAADVYVDVAPNDGVMDDLSGDGRITKTDANWLYDFASGVFSKRADIPRGGIGAYKANAVHGPFVHIDGRGQRARWGR